MYMYLSDRIRRMFLSGACPQNISPKKPLSLKDQRFLQKTKADKNLSRVLVKQQKLLYEKHIGLLLEKEKKATANLNLKPLPFQEKIKNKADTDYFSTNSQGLFVQNIKVQKKKQGGLFDSENKKKVINKVDKAPFTLEKNRILNIGKPFNQDKLKTDALPCSFGASTNHGRISFVYNAKPLFVNDESTYTNCRYLYDHESLKTSIVPQIFKNQKPISRAKTLLHERKKIALLYGHLAKKDIINISKKALSIPGFFEDNMFTLLESRVDVCVFRAGFSKTIAGARQLIRNGSVLVNGQKIYSCKRKARPGDYFSFTNKQSVLNPYRSTTLDLYRLCLSSNFLREWVSLNKIKFLWQVTFKHQYSLAEIQSKKNKTLSIVPEWLLSLFFAVPCTKKIYEPGLCYSLYWGFFLYKLKKMPVFSCFFEQKKKSNKGFNTFEKYRFNGINKIPLDAGKRGKARKLWHKGQQLPFNSVLAKKWGEVWLQEKSKTCFQTKPNDKHIINNVSLAELSQARISQSKPYLAWLTCMAQCFTFEKKERKNHKSQTHLCSALIRKKGVVLLNLYTQLLLKKQKKKAEMYPCSKNWSTDSLRGPNPLFRKKIPSSSLWAIWGQKPLHLEISHKTGGFIYMYKPQKIISPVCLDFKP